MENARNRTDSKTKVMMMKKPPTTTFRKVQIVYYLSRNGQLEHPHFMEVSHIAHHPLRLKDVMDRLMLLRGKGMPSLYSWSCKRSYKNGYVWNDLGENDVVYPSESEGGAEYILKGSEIHLQASSSSSKTKKMQQNDVSPRPMQQVTGDPVTGICPKRTTQHAKRHSEPQEAVLYSEEEEEENYDDEYEDDDDEKEKAITHRSSKETPKPATLNPNCDSEGTESTLSRNSVLFQLIACGGGGATAIKGSRIISSPAVVTTYREKTGTDNLHKGVLRNRAAAAAAATELEEKMIIRCMSENPRFGNLQAEEKEYFSGSIVESMISKEERVKSVESAQLKKSSSYNEERSGKSGLGETEEEEKGAADKVKKEEMKKREKVVKCIPRMRSSCTKQPNKKK